MSGTLVTRYLCRKHKAPQGSTPYPAANDLMLTYSAATVDAAPAAATAAPLALLLQLLLFPVAPLNLIKKLPPPQDANWELPLTVAQHANYKCCRTSSCRATKRVNFSRFSFQLGN